MAGMTSAVKSLWRAYNSVSLILRIVIGMVLGVVVALLAPGWTGISILGDLFVGALRALAPILVFFLIMSALSGAKLHADGRFGLVILLYLANTIIASFVGVVAAFIFPQTITLTAAATNDAPSGIVEVLTNLLMNAVANPADALASANYIGILVWSLALGLIFRKVASTTTKTLLIDMSNAVSHLVRLVISFAPFGIFGLVFTSVSTSGMEIFADYGRLVLLLAGAMLFVAFLVEPLLASLVLRRNAWPMVLRCLKDSGITAFFTRSSAANIPVNMDLCSKFGLNQDFYSVSIPLGATINMSGASVVIAIMSLTAANTLGITVDLPSAFMMCFLATLGACGTSGIAGGSLMLIPMACSIFGITNDVAMQIVGVGFIISVIQDSIETGINSSGDLIFSAVAEYRIWLNEGRRLPKFWGPNKDEFAGLGDAKLEDMEGIPAGGQTVVAVAEPAAPAEELSAGK